MTARAAKPADADAIARIYNEGIAARIATFETHERTARDIIAWFDAGDMISVAEIDGKVGAFAHTSGYRDRPCYDTIREYSVYTASFARRKGLAKEVMKHLIEQAEQTGTTKLVSRIFPQNTASLALCSALGFREVGVYRRHGKLEGEWRDCVIVELLLGEAAD